jgi:protein-disulfide isomerase
MSKRPTKSNNSAATWWIIGLVGAIVVLGLIVVTGVPQAAENRARTTGTTLGSDSAPITLEEYADFQCPACDKFARQTLPQIEQKYVNNGTVKVVFHHFAFIGEESIRAGEAAECAGEQNAFWQYYDTLYANQGGENTGTFSDPNLVNFAKQLNLDTDKFSSCLQSDRYRAKVVADTNDGQARGVTSTPTLFINGRMVVGAISLTQFEATIGPLLNSSK